jgi:hypothetical protein
MTNQENQMSDYKLNEDAPAFSYTREELFQVITKIVAHPHHTVTEHDQSRSLAIMLVFDDYFTNYTQSDNSGGYCVYECDATDLTDFVRFKLCIDDYDAVSTDDILK